MANSKQISAKAVGKKLNLVINDEKYTRAFDSKDEMAPILEKVKEYNEKQSAAKEKAIIKLMTVDAEAKKEVVAEAKAVKAKKAAVKPVEAVEEVKSAAQITSDALAELIAQGYNVTLSQNAPKVGTRRTGEY